MDKFLIKTPRNADNTVKFKSKKSPVQATLFSLPGVVVLEEINKQKALLEDKNTPSTKKASILKELLGKSPSTKIIIDTAIGKAVRKLKKDEDSTVRALAEKVFLKWKALLEKRVDTSANRITVKSDEDTERLRESSKKFILASLPSGLSSDDRTKAACRIEEEVFHQSNRLVHFKYRRLSRRVVFALKREYQAKSFTRKEIRQLVESVVEH